MTTKSKIYLSQGNYGNRYALVLVLSKRKTLKMAMLKYSSRNKQVSLRLKTKVLSSYSQLTFR